MEFEHQTVSPLIGCRARLLKMCDARPYVLQSEIGYYIMRMSCIILYYAHVVLTQSHNFQFNVYVKRRQ